MFLYMLFANRDYVRPLYTDRLGLRACSASRCVLLALGGLAMSKLAKVEV